VGFIPAYCFTNGRRGSRGLQGRVSEVDPRVAIWRRPVTEILEYFISGGEVAWFRVADIERRAGCVGSADTSIKEWILDWRGSLACIAAGDEGGWTIMARSV
jgi:hypothetical protein